MAPRKKKAQQKVTKDDGNTAPKTVKTKNVAKRPTKGKVPARKVVTRNLRQPKKSTITKSNDHIEDCVENIIVTETDEIPNNVDNSSIESNEYSSVECYTSLDSQNDENETSTCELTEQLKNLEVQEQGDVMEELIEFDSVDNVITVDYVSQEVTLEVENDSSNGSNIALENSNENKIMKEEPIEIECVDKTNELEQNLSEMMNEFEIKSENEPDKLEMKLEENVDSHDMTINKDIETVDPNNDNDNEENELEENKQKNIALKLIDTEIEVESVLAINDEMKLEKTAKGRNKRNETKSVKGQKRETKNEKNKGTKAKTNPKSKTDEVDDGLIRRSSRIKSISVLKKPSVGHGLVKVKDPEVSDIKGENKKSTSSQNASNKNEPSAKPIKVKSRWRRSSELEMNVSSSEDSSKPKLKENPNISVDMEKKSNSPVKDELVESRLKQFVHLKENVYLTERFICKEAKKMTCDCFLTEEEKERGEMACGEDCLNRLLMIECGNLCQVGDRCANKKFQKTQFAPVEVFNTHKKGLGLRAAANIPYGEFILEYVGEVLDASEFDQRADEYSQDKNTHYYFMSLRSDAIIDATQKGNISRFINHSCEPNAETQKWTVNGELRIGFFSTRTILAGEEVTFDYRFERYGKEAQKCYCEAPSCRGWLGEEPDEDEEGEEEEEEEEEVVEEIVESKPVEEIVSTVKVEESSVQEVIPKVENEVPTPIAVVTKVKKTKSRRKLRKELFEDDQLDEEIDVLVTTGLKNQAHTLKLSRLMLRAKEPAQRAKLMRVLRRGELPCRRLFLDYHGLRLMHGYMIDAQHLCQIDKKYDSLRLEVLQTLAILPIPNKTMLQDSKVLATVEKWSVPLTSSTPLDSNSESNSPKVENEVSQSPTPTLLPETSQENAEKLGTEGQIIDDQIRKSVGMEEVKSECSYFKNTRGTALAEEIVNIFEDDSYLSSAKAKPIPVEIKRPLPNYEFEIIILSTKLVEVWSKLKEVFRIPKKERIEQMKEHEREANKGYIAGLGLEQYAERRNESRYNRGMQRSRHQDKKNFKSEERNHQQTLLSRHNRRKLFALQVEQQEEDRRRKQRELWIQHEKNCMLIGTDPRFTAPFDPTRGFQCIWNPQIGQWQNYPIPPSTDNPLGYGHMANMPIPVSLPNTNIPPPHIQSTPNYPYGMPQMQLSAPMPQISTNRNLSHMVPSMPVGRSPLPSSIPPSLLHQITPTGGNTIPTNIHQTPGMPGLPSLAPNMLPPTIPQTPPPLSAGVQGLHNPLGYSPQMIMGQTQSPVMYQQEKKSEIISIIGDVKFLGPIPPQPKLPPKWKCAKDKYGRPYYYHIKIRKSQWEPPPYEPPQSILEEDSESSSSESSSSNSDSSSEDSDSDDEIINDSRLLKQVKKQMYKEFKVATPIKTTIAKIPSNIEDTPSPMTEVNDETQSEVQDSPLPVTEEESSIDKRLKEQFNLLDEDGPSVKRRKNSSLVQEVIISPRTDEDRLVFKEDVKRYKENKLLLKRQKEIILQQRKKHMKEKKIKQQPSKAKLREMKYCTKENSKKIKETFRSAMANTVVNALNAFRKPDCKEGRITNTEDFKHLARKLTHFVMLKEMKYISEIEELVCSDSVKVKAKDFIRKYMSKFGEVYVKRDDEPEHYY